MNRITEEGEPREVLELYIKTSEYYEYKDEYGGSSGYTQKQTPLCCSETMGEDIDKAITLLYRAAVKHQNDIRISLELKGVLDNFLKL